MEQNMTKKQQRRQLQEEEVLYLVKMKLKLPQLIGNQAVIRIAYLPPKETFSIGAIRYPSSSAGTHKGC